VRGQPLYPRYICPRIEGDGELNREEALARFIGESLKELTDPACDRTQLRGLRQRFFTRHRLEAAAHFSNQDVARELVRRLSRSREQVDVDPLAIELIQLTIVSEQLAPEKVREIIATTRLGLRSKLSSEELGKAGREEYLNRVERELTDEAKKSAEKELDLERQELDSMRRSLETERNEIEALKSALDELPPDVIEEELVSGSQDEGLPKGIGVWWKELGLEGNPFASNQGLSQIPEAKFESIVVQTPFIKCTCLAHDRAL
jgi:hypothetical protein